MTSERQTTEVPRNSATAQEHSLLISGKRKPADWSETKRLCGALEGHGLATRGWKRLDEFGWSCSSSYQNIGESGPTPLPTNLAYYVEGPGAGSANQIQLVLNINNAETRTLGLEKLQPQLKASSHL